LVERLGQMIEPTRRRSAGTGRKIFVPTRNIFQLRKIADDY